ncbi:MAG: HAMP domain-containing protein [Flavobacteriales bacterium]|nr:HAMP domain-containing protein [Flavobacteriales bacterium]
MAWRFADLPVRTKFLITLGIPVLGLVLLIGKQVDSSYKRRNVLRYINVQSRNMELQGGALAALQEESAFSVAYSLGLASNPSRLQVLHASTDRALQRLNDPDLLLDPGIAPQRAVAGIGVLRQRVRARRIGTGEVELSYRRVRGQMLGDVSKTGKLALDPATKDRMYAHMSLLSMEDALANIRSLIALAGSEGHDEDDLLGTLNEQIAQFETSALLFERDAPPEVLALYGASFRGPDVNALGTLVSTVQETRALPQDRLEVGTWWRYGAGAMARLRTVEQASIARIVEATTANQRDAELRLFVVLVALTGVVGAVAVMAFVIMRGLRNTVNEVTSAASALAQGDVRAHVPVSSNDEVGAMARSFNGMIDNIRSLAAAADAIGKGNYDTPVPVRGELDVLGLSLERMKDNLKAARDRDLEQKTALEAEKEKLERANARINVLIKEIHHRVKNNLQVIASMLRLQSSTIEDRQLRQLFDQSQSRVASIALIHEKLYKGDDLASLDLALYLKELFAELVQLNDVSEAIRYRTDIDKGLALDLNTMVPLGLILNELITNSFKHAFKGRSGGNIELAIHRVDGGDIDLQYRDDGVGIPQEKLLNDGATLGVSLIESLVEQLNGFFTVDSDATGTRYHIRIKPA